MTSFALRRLAVLVWLGSTGLIACADDGASGGGGAGGAGGAGAGAGGGSGGEVPVDPTPILERPPAISHACTETRPMTQEPGATSMRVEGLVAQGGAFFELRAADTLRVAEVGLDGALAGSADLVTEPYAFRSPTLVASADGLAAVWSAPGETITFARLDTTPALVAGPTAIPATSAAQSGAAALVPDGDGFALFYGASAGAGVDLSFLRLDADGNALGSPATIAPLGETYLAEAAAVATGDGGFALAYAAGPLGQTEIDFTVVDADGAPRFAPRRISAAPTATVRSALTPSPRRSLIAVGERFWVTFTETDADDATQEGHTIVRVADVGADGAATLSALEAPVDQAESLWPSFVPLGQRVGLAWTHGTIIWICGGCISDHDMHFVLLDQATLAPASEVVTHAHVTNGIVAPLLAASGADILDASVLDFHAVTLPASGGLRCDPVN